MSETYDDHNAELQQTFSEESYGAPQQASGCRNFALGCGCAAGFLLLLMVGGGVWIAMNWKAWAADFTKQVAADAVAKSTLPAEEKARILTRINSLADDFKAGKVSTQQLGHVMKQIAQSPLLPLGLVMAADEKYVKPSGLSGDDQDAARRTLQRLARGAFEKSIPENEVQEVMQRVMNRQPDGSQQLKERLTDDELKAFLEKAKEKADAASVPNEPFNVNIADEIEKAIDNAIKP